MPSDEQIKLKVKKLFSLNPNRQAYTVPSTAKQVCKLLGNDTTSCKTQVIDRLEVLYDANSNPQLDGAYLRRRITLRSLSSGPSRALPSDTQVKDAMKQLFKKNPQRHYYNIPAAAKQICKRMGNETAKCKKHVERRLIALHDEDSIPRRAGSRIFPS